MRARFAVGDRVQIRPRNAPAALRSAGLTGEVIGVRPADLGRWVTVRWDIDGQETRCSRKVLVKIEHP